MYSWTPNAAMRTQPIIIWFVSRLRVCPKLINPLMTLPCIFYILNYHDKGVLQLKLWLGWLLICLHYHFPVASGAQYKSVIALQTWATPYIIDHRKLLAMNSFLGNGSATNCPWTVMWVVTFIGVLFTYGFRISMWKFGSMVTYMSSVWNLLLHGHIYVLCLKPGIAGPDSTTRLVL